MSGNAGSPYRSPVNFRLPATPWRHPDPAVQSVFTEQWNVLQQFAQTFNTNCGIAPRVAAQVPLLQGSASTLLSSNDNRYYEIAIENIVAGAAVNLTATGVRNANATTNAKPADGFCSQPGGIASGETGEVILTRGIVTGLTGLVKGTRYYLATVAGTYTSVKPVAAGNIEQYLGFAIDAATLNFSAGSWIQH